MAQNVKPSAQRPKKRAVISYDKGYADYMGDIFKVDKPDGTFFYAVEVDIPDAVYLVKIDVDIDDYEKAENDLFDEDVVDDTVVPEIEGDVFPGEAEEMQEEDDRLDD